MRWISTLLLLAVGCCEPVCGQTYDDLKHGISENGPPRSILEPTPAPAEKEASEPARPSYEELEARIAKLERLVWDQSDEITRLGSLLSAREHGGEPKPDPATIPEGYALQRIPFYSRALDGTVSEIYRYELRPVARYRSSDGIFGRPGPTRFDVEVLWTPGFRKWLVDRYEDVRDESCLATDGLFVIIHGESREPLRRAYSEYVREKARK